MKKRDFVRNEKKMICPRCNKTYSGEYNFCPLCGEKLTSSVQDKPSVPDRKPRKIKNKTFGYWVKMLPYTVIVTLILSVIMYVATLGKISYGELLRKLSVSAVFMSAYLAASRTFVNYLKGDIVSVEVIKRTAVYDEYQTYKGYSVDRKGNRTDYFGYEDNGVYIRVEFKVTYEFGISERVYAMEGSEKYKKYMSYVK